MRIKGVLVLVFVLLLLVGSNNSFGQGIGDELFVVVPIPQPCCTASWVDLVGEQESGTFQLFTVGEGANVYTVATPTAPACYDTQNFYFAVVNKDVGVIGESATDEVVALLPQAHDADSILGNIPYGKTTTSIDPNIEGDEGSSGEFYFVVYYKPDGSPVDFTKDVPVCSSGDSGNYLMYVEKGIGCNSVIVDYISYPDCDSNGVPDGWCGSGLDIDRDCDGFPDIVDKQPTPVANDNCISLANVENFNQKVSEDGTFTGGLAVSQINPDVSGNIVVWQDARNGDWDIYYADLKRPKKGNVRLPMFSYSGDQVDPYIYGGIIVWEDNRKGDWDIYYYDLSKPEQGIKAITTNVENQINPDVSGNIVVWQDSRTGQQQIYYCDLSTYSSSNPEGCVKPVSDGTGIDTSPKVSGNIVVWQDGSVGNGDIFYRDLTGPAKVGVTNDDYQQGNPSVNGNIIVWVDMRNGNFDIYYYDISKPTQGTLPAITGPSQQTHPVIGGRSGYLILYADDKTGSGDIYGYDLSTRQYQQVTSYFYNDLNPQIGNSNVMVWQGFNGNNFDIWAYGPGQKDHDSAVRPIPAWKSTGYICDECDGIGDACDNCPVNLNADQIDTDKDGKGDVCDNCKFVVNADQIDTDGDGIGDACDGTGNVGDLCAENRNCGDSLICGPESKCIMICSLFGTCVVDTDGDGVNDLEDNCVNVANPDQLDSNNNGIGDACEGTLNDNDGDGILNDVDNCRDVANPDQLDSNGNGIGDACEGGSPTDSDGDGVNDANDNCPNVPNPDQADSNGDGIGDACQKVAGEACQGEGECMQGTYCASCIGVCKAIPTCTSDADCGGGTLIGIKCLTEGQSAGYCGPVSCTSDADCSGTICENGECRVPMCATNADCNSGVCNMDICVCATSEEGGNVQEGGECSINTDCIEGYMCVDKYCTTPGCVDIGGMICENLADCVVCNLDANGQEICEAGNIQNLVPQEVTIEANCYIAVGAVAGGGSGPEVKALEENIISGKLYLENKGPCRDEDGDGLGISEVRICEAGIDGACSESSKVEDNVAQEAGYEAAQFEEDCTVRPKEVNPVPFFSYGSILLTFLLLGMYYFRRKH